MDASLSDIPAVIQSCVIVGGGGYLGNKLAASLESYGCQVKLFDKSPSAAYSKSSSFTYVSFKHIIMIVTLWYNVVINRRSISCNIML